MHVRSYPWYQSLPLYALVAVALLVPFGYHPSVSLGSESGVHLDGSLLYLVLLIAVGVNLPAIWTNRQQLFSLLPVRLLYCLLGYTAIAGLWSPNPFRAIVTAGFLALLILLVSAVVVQHNPLSAYTRNLKRVLFIPYYLVAGWALWQIAGEAFGVPGSLTLLPGMYGAEVFGIARPTGFVLEPQFLASLLLAPLLWLIWRRIGVKYPTVPRSDTLALVILSGLLVLTLSRGGILALSVGILCVAVCSSHNLIRRWGATLGWLALGTALAFTIVFSFAQLNRSTNISGYESVSRVINHLSFSLVTLPTGSPPTQATPATKDRPTPGYVESSTDSRLSMSDQALKLWSRDPGTMLFGVGTGGFGRALEKSGQADDSGSIVNNTYIEQLVETGLIGLVLFLAFCASLLLAVYRSRQLLMLPILAAFLVQWNFFSGNGNIVHVWVVIAIAIAIVAAIRHKTATIR